MKNVTAKLRCVCYKLVFQTLCNSVCQYVPPQRPSSKGSALNMGDVGIAPSSSGISDLILVV